MPASCTVSTKKTKTRTQILCQSMEKAIAEARNELAKDVAFKKELEYEPGLLREAIEKGLIGDKEEVKKLFDEQKQWKDEVKSDIKAAVMAEKQRIKQERRTKRKSGKGTQSASDKPQKRHRATGRLI